MNKKDSSFPIASLGRSIGARLQGSSDSLSHPLLSSSSQPSATLQPAQQQQQHNRKGSDQIQDPLNLGAAPKYVPYTPRHRPPPSSPTTSTSVQTSVTTTHGPLGGATGKLQIQNMKAAAQGLGLGNFSIGAAMLEHFVEGELGKWTEAWNLITTGKASRGIVEGNQLSLRSTIPTSSAFFNSLINQSTRSSTLIAAPPLAHPISPIQSTPYPTFSLPNYSANLPCPQRAIPAMPPPLPPRSLGKVATGTASPLTPGSRLNPFASLSLFGRSPSTTTPSTPPTSTVSLPPRPPSPQPSISSADSAAKPPDVFQISVFVIDRPIKRKQVLKEIQRATKAQIKDTLGSQGANLPNWMVTRVADFAAVLNELYFAPHLQAEEGEASAEGDSGSIRSLRLATQSKDWTPDLSTPASTSSSFQAFFTALEEDITTYYGASGSPTSFVGPAKQRQATSSSIETEKPIHSRQGSLMSMEANGETDENKRAQMREKKIKETMDMIERVICSLFYDRLFAPEGSDDRSHDEALASRVAALHMLDLALEHLGVDVGNAGTAGVDRVAQAVGKELQRLEDPFCRAPGEKAAILVAAHKVIVATPDGLGKLPPIKLKPDSAPEPVVDTDKTPRAPTFPDSVTQYKAASPLPTIRTLEPDAAVDTPLQPAPVPASATSETQVASVSSTTPSITDASLKSSDTAATSTVPSDDVLATTPSENTTPVSSDLLIPILIYSVVKSNPTQLVSHVLYVERYRRHSAAGGEEGFCLINVMAVADFLENVDMEALGLAETDRVRLVDVLPSGLIVVNHPTRSVHELEPIPIPVDATALVQPTAAEMNLSARLRGKVEQQVGELAGSANKVFTGVVDSGFSALRGFLGGDQNAATQAVQAAPADATKQSPRQGFGLLRRASGFSIASVAASLPVSRRIRSSSVGTSLTAEETGQQMVEVPSRPGSVRSGAADELSDEETSSSQLDSDEESGSDEEEGMGARSDVRSIRSFGSMMSEAKEEAKQRKSLSDRLANVSRLGIAGSPSREGSLRKPSPPPSRPASLLLSPKSVPIVLTHEPPTALPPIAPPTQRFLDCHPNDLKIGEIPALLEEYRRMVTALRTRGAFEGTEFGR
ncbi:hypothetical protein FRC04_005563 [Tulasnella sp. 424]|nr:hypothetical protein FRC04_005563 [Tulasnella sp. 424]